MIIIWQSIYVKNKVPRQNICTNMGSLILENVNEKLNKKMLWVKWRPQVRPGARPTKHISIEFEIRWKFKTL